ncbi:TOMM precursor leader peptide-binding protein [Streptomyces cyaneofuscatus]|uniref:TOMM leader peptide-binding protein n=1 Tax=Streptomyces cyaneofuscatus TaxID=66883 RepID=A0ABZ1EVQ1_9ACTN|nr:TOMM precursor leader peptide-binding protein [Streptomyces cyaneofuscatus]WSB08146.1 TOMM precursor leader peptide-binding protein [Streptomyces cyaneofuscatus]WSD48321.1 TOMM precursor leader peptide-binding protein [Streptomyces cyaneofuscatus]
MTTATVSLTPLDAARDQLQAALSARHSGYSGHSGRSLPAPYVVPLGAADTLGFGHPDPYADTRPAADVQLTSRAVLIGPWGGGPSGAACGQCLAMRWQRLRSRSEREALELGHEPRGAVHWPVLTAYAVDAVWATYSALFTGRRSNPDATPADRALPQVTRIDLATLATATFPLLPEPLCPACVVEVPDTAEAARMELGPTPKPDPDGYRLRTLDSYPLPTAALANPVCGALGSDTWINPASTTTAPVAGTHFVRGYAGLNDVTWSGQANRYATSRTLAYLEGLERYAGTHRRRGTSPVVDSYRNLAEQGQALNPADCGFYAPETYASDPLVSPFDPDRAIPWVWGHSLRDDAPILVPARLAHYSAGVDADNFVFECSNGCATGGSPEEAILFGLLELVERDAFLLAWYGRARLTAIDLATATTPAVRSMLDRAALHGYDVHAFDTRMDLAVPVVTALAVRRDGGHGTLSFSAAAGFDPADTVEAALSEVLTYIPHLPYQVAERRTELEAMEQDFSKVLHLKDHAQLYGLPSMVRHAAEYLEPEAVLPLEEVFADWQPLRPRTGDLLDDLRCLRDQLTDCGYDVIAVDQTTPEQHRMGLHTVSTTAPGLLPLDFGWTRQRALHMPRLRTALRAAGRRADDLPEAEIKAVPHPFP